MDKKALYLSIDRVFRYLQKCNPKKIGHENMPKVQLESIIFKDITESGEIGVNFSTLFGIMWEALMKFIYNCIKIRYF